MGINNINLAQNRTEDLAKDAGEKNLLKKSGMSEADIDAMKSEDREKKANKLLRDSENSKLSKEFSKEAIEKMSQAERERHLDRIEGVASVDNFTADQARLTQLLNQEANLVVKVKK